MGARWRASKAGTGLTLATALLLCIGASACGSSSKSDAADNIISAGQANIQLPPGWTVTKDGKGAIRPASDSASSDAGSAVGASGATGSASGDTVPLASEDPTTKFFGAVGIFQACLKSSGVKFIGAPDASNPNAPSNDPTYIKGLSTCAAKSNIVQALKDQQTAQDNLTPAQIKTQNKGYLAWRECMIGRGWGIPEPQPDAKGRLFTFGGTTPNFTPPPGQDILTTNDTSECASAAEKKFGGTGG